MPTVSVIIPTYNHQDYVLATLDSVFSQTFTDYEIIVVNDGSPDATADLLKPLRESGQIKYVEQMNAGQPAARNRGLIEAKGEFIAFLDDDDLWPDDKLEWQVKYLQSHDDVGVIGGALEDIDSEGKTFQCLPMRKEPITTESLLRGNFFVSPGQTLVRANVLRSLGGFDETLWGVDDFDLWFRMANCTRVVGVPKVSLKYRTHANNSSKNYSRMFAGTLKVINTYLAHIPKPKRLVSFREAHRFLYYYLGRTVIRDFKEGLRAGDLNRTVKNVSMLSVFVRPCVYDRKLFMQISRDLCPHKLKKLRAELKVLKPR